MFAVRSQSTAEDCITTFGCGQNLIRDVMDVQLGTKQRSDMRNLCTHRQANPFTLSLLFRKCIDMAARYVSIQSNIIYTAMRKGRLTFSPFPLHIILKEFGWERLCQLVDQDQQEPRRCSAACLRDGSLKEKRQQRRHRRENTSKEKEKACHAKPRATLSQI